MARSMKEVHTINYYPINEGAARRAKEMNSFSDYKEGSATAEYRAMVDKAAVIAEKQKSRVDPMYHEKIDHLLDTYARKLAENMNQGFAIDARVPSVMIAGPANFPVGKKGKQNRARDSNMEDPLSVKIAGHAINWTIFAVLSAFPIFLPTHTGIKVPKWFFYAFYPAHLAAIGLARVILNV